MSADGMSPVATPEPLAVILPVPRSTLNAETDLSPCVVTKRAPVPGEEDEFLEQLVRKPSEIRTSRPANPRNFIPILSPCFFSGVPTSDETPPDQMQPVITLICVSGMPGKSKPPKVVGTVVNSESCLRCSYFRRYRISQPGALPCATAAVCAITAPGPSVGARGRRISTINPPCG